MLSFAEFSFFGLFLDHALQIGYSGFSEHLEVITEGLKISRGAITFPKLLLEINREGNSVD